MSAEGPVGSYKGSTWVVIALSQGIVAPLLFAGIAIVGGLMRPGYSHFSQAISELTEAGAADKIYLDLPLLIMEFLTIIFGFGFFWAVRKTNNWLKMSAGLMVFIGVIGIFFYCFPMDPMGTPMTPDGRIHLIIVSLSAVAAMLSVLSSALGWSRLSARRTVARICFALLAIMLASGMASAAAGVLGWPGIGVWQRVNTGAFSAWQITTAIYLARASRLHYHLDKVSMSHFGAKS